MDTDQSAAILSIYNAEKHSHWRFDSGADSQKVAQDILKTQRINIRQLGDLGNQWSR
ncbi:MAG TPA: hypothetical protein VGO47_09925 [Chlamydiales bacterium]|nr:hypothetical protein [Chlamydiales bacterium]